MVKLGHKTLNKTSWLGVLLAASSILLISCSSSFKVEGDYPTPIVNQLPYTLGVVYDDAFRNYEYVESAKGRAEWHIDIGDAQTELFSTILPAMFEAVVPLSHVTAATQRNRAIEPETMANNVDLVLSPVLTDFQYNLPKETKVKMYEVWMKYNLRVYEPDGELIADWILTAYGKTPVGFMTSNEEALNQAMVIALRDLGAGVSLTFTKVPEINAWLKKQNAKLASLETANASLLSNH
ncbi:hypothetical protein [Flocculibacter collagenilyticus]|uniref:hypothetical protein n=1 Tax=Flocculibacter collagenilyticus TaxID=2744479 RepID=UPI0018F41F05|nr:hypothetical protein [Flocculibacter collagenilyticus]